MARHIGWQEIMADLLRILSLTGKEITIEAIKKRELEGLRRLAIKRFAPREPLRMRDHAIVITCRGFPGAIGMNINTENNDGGFLRKRRRAGEDLEMFAIRAKGPLRIVNRYEIELLVAFFCMGNAVDLAHSSLWQIAP